MALATSEADVTMKSTSSSVNSRGASVCAVIAPIASPLRPTIGTREERLVALLLELRHVLHARVGERIVTDERRLAVLDRPPREALATLERDLSRLGFVRRRGRTKNEPLVVLEEVHETRVDAARLGHQPDDRRQHLCQLERRCDGRDDLLQELLARLQGHRA